MVAITMLIEITEIINYYLYSCKNKFHYCARRIYGIQRNINMKPLITRYNYMLSVLSYGYVSRQVSVRRHQTPEGFNKIFFTRDCNTCEQIIIYILLQYDEV